MTLEITQILTTYAEFEAFIDEHPDQHFELIDGAIVGKPMPSQIHGRIAMRIGSRLTFFVEAHHLGYVEIEVLYRNPADDHNARQPDLSFFADKRMPAVARGAVPRMPDLAIEIQSPSNRLIGLQRKAHYFLENGARLVWIVRPKKRLIEVHTLDDLWVLGEGDTLDGGEVLPGFTLPVAEVFAVLKAEGNDQ